VRWASARPLLGYGLQIVLVDILGAVIINVDNLIVGRLLGNTALGLYALAFTIPQMLTISLAVAMSTAVFPAFASIQNDRPALQRHYLTVQHYTAMIILPVGVGLFSVAPSLVHALYQPVWWPMIPVMQVLALFAALHGLVWSAGDSYKAVGRPDFLWKMALAQAPVLVLAVLIGAELDGIVGVALGRIVVVVPVTLVSFWLVHRVLRVEARAIARALRVPLFAAGVMLSFTELLSWILTPHLTPVVVLIVQVLGGIVVFGAVAISLDPESRALLTAWRRQRTTMASTPPSPDRLHQR
jgi:PST family polysaccharide transporter